MKDKDTYLLENIYTAARSTRRIEPEELKEIIDAMVSIEQSLKIINNEINKTLYNKENVESSEEEDNIMWNMKYYGLLQHGYLSKLADRLKGMKDSIVQNERNKYNKTSYWK